MYTSLNTNIVGYFMIYIVRIEQASSLPRDAVPILVSKSDSWSGQRYTRMFPERDCRNVAEFKEVYARDILSTTSQRTTVQNWHTMVGPGNIYLVVDGRRPIAQGNCLAKWLVAGGYLAEWYANCTKAG